MQAKYKSLCLESKAGKTPVNTHWGETILLQLEWKSFYLESKAGLTPLDTHWEEIVYI